MSRRLLLAAALLCALPARGAETTLPDPVVNALTPIDSVPSTVALNEPPVDPLVEPIGQPGDPSTDLGIQFGIQLRAIRALPSYCPPSPAKCGPGTVARDTLFAILTSYVPLSISGAQLPGHEVLRLRAAAEALGATRSDQNEDVAALTALLVSPSRDVRATAVRALRNFCNDGAKLAVRNQISDASAQVRAEVRAALQAFEQCPK
jgi:hypothetical protein